VLTGLAMRWRICNGLTPRQAVDADIQEAAHYQAQNGEEEYPEYFHGRLLWTYYRLEVNRQQVLLPGVARADIGGTFVSLLGVPLSVIGRPAKPAEAI